MSQKTSYLEFVDYFLVKCVVKKINNSTFFYNYLTTKNCTVQLGMFFKFGIFFQSKKKKIKNLFEIKHNAENILTPKCHKEDLILFNVLNSSEKTFLYIHNSAFLKEKFLLNKLF